MQLLIPTPDVVRAREKWRYFGQERPAFAVPPGSGQISVWDFPRPPRIEDARARLRVESSDRIIAETTRGVRVLETAGAPTYYFPPEDVDSGLLKRTGSAFHCEWKGISDEIAIEQSERSGWVLRQVYAEFEALLGWFAFYPQDLRCFVGNERVGAQPGGYYGGWVTADLVGPIKGEPGSGGW